MGSAALGYVTARRQVTDQGRIEHAREVRSERRDAYLAVLGVAEPLEASYDKLIKYVGRPVEVRDEQELRTLSETMRAADETFYALLFRVELCGPAEVWVTAAELWEEIHDLADFVEASAAGEPITQAGLDRVIDSLSRSRTEFVRSARSVMARPPN